MCATRLFAAPRETLYEAKVSVNYTVMLVRFCQKTCRTTTGSLTSGNARTALLLSYPLHTVRLQHQSLLIVCSAALLEFGAMLALRRCCKAQRPSAKGPPSQQLRCSSGAELSASALLQVRVARAAAIVQGKHLRLIIDPMHRSSSHAATQKALVSDPTADLYGLVPLAGTCAVRPANRLMRASFEPCRSGAPPTKVTYTLSESIEQLSKPSATVPLADRCAVPLRVVVRGVSPGSTIIQVPQMSPAQSSQREKPISVQARLACYAAWHGAAVHHGCADRALHSDARDLYVNANRQNHCALQLFSGSLVLVTHTDAACARLGFALAVCAIASHDNVVEQALLPVLPVVRGVAIACKGWR